MYVVLSYYRIDLTHEQIESSLGTSKEDGTDTQPIINFLCANNLKVVINDRASIEDIEQSIEQGQPMLITIDNWEHWVIVYGYSQNRIFLMDSNKKRFLNSMSRSEFEQRWDDNWLAVIKNS